MKVVVDYKNEDVEELVVINAKFVGDFVIRLTFNDGIEKVVDFKPFLNNSMNPSIRKYLDERLFTSFEIVDGNLNWNDFELIFPVMDLYQGSI